MSAVEILGLWKSFGGHFALHIPSLSISEGTVLGIVGPNGAGKSTTMNLLAGILRPTAGEIQLLGTNLDRDPVPAKRCMGVVPEGLGLFEQLRGGEFLYCIGRLYGLDKPTVLVRSRGLLAALGLEDDQGRFVHTYSSGMKRKLAFAAAVLHGPKVLLLDEPLEGVDPFGAMTMKGIITRLRSRGTAIVITSHNLDLVERLCSEVALLDKGRIVFQSVTGEIRLRVKDEVSQETYASLEEVFVRMVGGDGNANMAEIFSWL